MKYLEIVQKDFMGEQVHKVSDIKTARHFLYAWFQSHKRAADYMNLTYKPVKQFVLQKDTHSDEVTDWVGYDGKRFDETTDELDFVFLLFRHEVGPAVLEILKPWRLAPELKETYVATTNQPQGMYGLAIAYDRNARESVSSGLLPVVDFFHATCGRSRTKNKTGIDTETVISQIDCHAVKVRWPSNHTIYSRNLKEFAKEKK